MTIFTANLYLATLTTTTAAARLYIHVVERFQPPTIVRSASERMKFLHLTGDVRLLYGIVLS